MEKRGDDILHISLRNWADVFLIAPLSANSLAKITHGISDNLILTIARGWKFHKKFVIAPSMNKYMWEHPVTRQQITTLLNWGIKEIPPRCKMLSGGDFGLGAMENPEIIKQFIEDLFEND